MLILAVLLFGEQEDVLQFFSSQQVDDVCHLNSSFFFIDTLIGPAFRCNSNAGQCTRYPVKSRLGRWLVNQHGAQWRSLGDTQRQARELISGHIRGTRAKFITFNRIQSRAVTGITPCGDICTYWGCTTGPCAGSAGRERKPRLTVYVSAML